MTLFDYECGFVAVLPPDLVAQMDALAVRLAEHGVNLHYVRCPHGHVLTKQAERPKPPAMAPQARLMMPTGQTVSRQRLCFPVPMKGSADGEAPKMDKVDTKA